MDLINICISANSIHRNNMNNIPIYKKYILPPSSGLRCDLYLDFNPFLKYEEQEEPLAQFLRNVITLFMFDALVVGYLM